MDTRRIVIIILGLIIIATPFIGMLIYYLTK